MAKRVRPSRAKAKAAVSPNPPAPTGSPRPAPTSLQRTLDATARDGESARSRQTARRVSQNNRTFQRETPENTLKVMATQTGYYDHARRRPGDVFLIDATPLEADVVDAKGKVRRKKGDIAAFSSRWMQEVDPKTPESVSTANTHIKQQHDELLAARHNDGILTGPDNVPADLDDDHSNPLGE